MPLKKGSSKKVVKRNTTELMHTERKKEQAMPMAMSMAGKKKMCADCKMIGRKHSQHT